MIKKSMKKNLAIFVAMVLVFSSFGTSFAANFGDLNKAPWASETIQKWSDYGFVSGYGDSTFRPLADVTRAEFAVMAYNAFSLESKFGLNFSDVKSGDWFYDQVVKMSKLGYIKGYADGTFKPNAPIKRSEAVAMIANILGLTANEEAAKVFADYEAIPSWVRGQVGASAMAKFVSGYTDGTFKAEDTINRAESVAILNNAVYGANQFANSWRIVEAGTYGGTTEKPTVIEGNVVIKTPDVELKNVEIKGNLTIGVEVGEGDVDLTNVVVAGDTNVYGGGANSVKINGGSYGKVFIMKQADTPVRLLTVNVKGIDVVVPAASGAKNIILEGIFNSVQLLAAGTEVKTQGNTTISEISVAPTAVETVITTSEGTVIAKAIINVNLKVLGQGRIVVAEVTVENVSFEKQPETVNDEPTTTTPPATGGSTGGGTVTPPATVYVNYPFQVQKNSENIQLVKNMSLAKGTTLSFSLISQIYDSFSQIPFGYQTISELLSLTNPDNGDKTYAEGLSAKVAAVNPASLKVLGGAINEFNTVTTDPSKTNIDALATKLLSYSLSDILDDLAVLYTGVPMPSRITFQFADKNNNYALHNVSIPQVGSIKSTIITELDGINMDNLVGKRGIVVTLDGTKTFTVWINAPEN